MPTPIAVDALDVSLIHRDAFFAQYRKHFGPLSQSKVDGLAHILQTFEEEDIQGLDLPFCDYAYMLATTYHETGFTMTPVVEHGPLSYFNKYNGRGGNGPTEGFKYRGRGYVQLTFKDNYAHAGDILKLDLVNHPDLVLAADVAGRILVEGMSSGWFTGKRLSNFLPRAPQSRPSDYFHARRIINGMDKADVIAGYAQKMEAILKESIAV